MLRGFAIVVLMLAGTALGQQPPEEPPDAAAVRLEVNKVLGLYAESEVDPSLGRIVDAANLSIAFGAPAYNVGDIEGCRDFYRMTMEHIVEEWGDADADPTTTEAVAVLKQTLERTDRLEGVDRQAWSLRYGWDRVVLMHATELVEVQGLLAVAQASMARGHYPEAVDAYGTAARMIDGLVGTAPRSIDVELRFAAIGEGHARLGLGDFRGAAHAVSRGLTLIPEWLTYEVDRASHHPDGEHTQLVHALEKAVDDNPDDVELRFLLAYEYAMLGRRKDAEKLLKKVLRADEDHAGARVLSGALVAR